MYTSPAKRPRTLKSRSRASWTEEDEIRLLNATLVMAGKKAENKHGGYSAPPLFDEIESSLHGDFSREQLVDKLKGLKRRFQTRSPEIPTHSAHDRKLFEICQKIWGGGSLEEEEKEESEQNEVSGSKDGMISEPDVSEFFPRYAFNLGMMKGCGDFDMLMREGLERLDGWKAKELKDKWRLQEMREMEVFRDRVALIREQMDLIIEAVNPSKYQPFS